MGANDGMGESAAPVLGSAAYVAVAVVRVAASDAAARIDEGSCAVLNV
jgi:hypothetical protein